MSNNFEDLGLELLLYGIQSPVNIGMILRTAEVYQVNVSLLDLHRVFENPESFKTIEDFACGAISRRPLERLEDPSAIARLRNGRRLIATWIGPDTSSLVDFQFLPGDVIVLGNEYDGLPDDFAASAEERLHIPTPAAFLPKKRSHSPIDANRTTPVAREGQPSLNVAMTAGILCYTAYAQGLAKRNLPSTDCS